MTIKAGPNIAAEADLMIPVTSQGTAALWIVRNLVRALLSKNVLTENEVRALLDEASDPLRGGGDALTRVRTGEVIGGPLSMGSMCYRKLKKVDHHGERESARRRGSARSTGVVGPAEAGRGSSLEGEGRSAECGCSENRSPAKAAPGQGDR